MIKVRVMMEKLFNIFIFSEMVFIFCFIYLFVRSLSVFVNFLYFV